MTPFIGQIALLAGPLPPFGWAFCAGQALSVATATSTPRTRRNFIA